jgi:hypothetical protein
MSRPTRHGRKGRRTATRLPFKLACTSRPICLILFSLLAFLFHPAQAVILMSTDNPQVNITPPGGALTNSGWQLQGLWNLYLGTPIAPKFFIAAGHVLSPSGQPLAPGEPFYFHGRRYNTTAVFEDPASDLQIWSVCGTFPEYATLYTGSDEVGKDCVVFGRGTLRGEPVTVERGTLKGWKWGLYEQNVRWGENTVEEVVDLGITYGETLRATFDIGAGPNECHLSLGDSSGAMFILDGGVWKLAGIHLATDGPYNTTPSDPGFNAAIFDEGGLFSHSSGSWTFVQDTSADIPGGFYSTRISSRMAWINLIIGNTPPPPDPPPVLESAPNPAGAYTNELLAVSDINARTITIPLPPEDRFYRLNSCTTLELGEIEVTATQLILHYQ